jgi:DNA-binding NarL/FixJ family response regulator
VSKGAASGDDRTGPVPEVLVASDQALVGEAVRAALVDRGFTVQTVPWRGRSRPVPYPRRGAARVPRVGLMVCSLDRWSLLYEARTVMVQVEVPWAVITDAAPGPAWGGLLVGGAELVLSGAIGLDEVCENLIRMAENRASMPRELWASSVSEWLESAADRESNAARIARLSQGQRRVLELLHLGIPVAEIAHRLGVAPSTVRSQVKEVLRRLEVGNQLAAVAAFEVDRSGPGLPDVHRRRSSGS